uniref:Uncharacterized protein n=1 Tax=Tanacetum cinerariifolium TaxID=118510 RepID=A0A699HSJ2_TANCI|nr:hypothetical protein [Tanacetum cinerariifolium]
MKLSDAIAANISRAEKKKKCRIVCRTHEVGSAHNARSDGVPVSVPTVVPRVLPFCWWTRPRRLILRTLSFVTFIVPPVYVLCSMGVFAISRRLGYSIEDPKSAAARVATRLCGGPCTEIHGSWLFGNNHRICDESKNVPLYYHMYDNFQIQFGREEFCLVIGLKFGVEYSDDCDDNDKPIPFRRRVFSSCLDAKLITEKDVKDLIESKSLKN